MQEGLEASFEQLVGNDGNGEPTAGNGSIDGNDASKGDPKAGNNDKW